MIPACLMDSTFWVPALAAMALALAAAIVGSTSVLRGQSLVGDAIGHASLPGVMLAFMLADSREPWILMLGAMAFGWLAYRLIEYFAGPDKDDLDRAQAIVLSSFFGLGITLKSLIQSAPRYRDSPKAGLESYILGQAALASRADLKLILVVAALTLLLFFLFYKEIKLMVFDRDYAAITGFKPERMQQLNLLLTLALIATGLRVVGAILIAALLVAPTVTALQWKNTYREVLFLAGLTGAVSAFGGTVLGRQGLPNGAAIVLVLSIIAFISIIFGSRGVLARRRQKRLATARMESETTRG